MSPDRRTFDVMTLVPRIVAGVFGFAFSGIGITTIVFLWAGRSGAPLEFRIFGSFIAIVFVVVGGTMLLGAVMSRGLMDPARLIKTTNELARSTDDLNDVVGQPGSSTNYACPKCGAQLDKAADVSPLGDVKCSFCNQWFNVHRS